MIIWLVFTFVSAGYFISKRLAPFDPQQSLKGVSNAQFLSQLVSSYNLQGVTGKAALIHFISEDCHCTQFSENHKADINKLAASLGFNILQIVVTADGPIPSTPSIAIISATQQLLYYGPYSTGLACSESNGYVEMVLQNYAKGYPAKLMVTDSDGCYCQL